MMVYCGVHECSFFFTHRQEFMVPLRSFPVMKKCGDCPVRYICMYFWIYGVTFC